MYDFQLLEPNSLLEASEMAKKYKKKAVFFAGGTDVLVNIKQKKLQPDFLINLKKIDSLQTINFDKDKGLKIGSVVTLAEIESNPIIKQNFPILSEASHSIAAQQIRNRGTIGGNVCNAAPSADTAPALIALDAKIKIFTLKGEKELLLEDFFIGPGKTILKEEELLKEFYIPILHSNSRTAFIKHSFRKALDLAMISIAIRLDIDSSRVRIEKSRIVLGAVAPTPIRARNAEEKLQKIRIGEVTKGQLEEIAIMASQEAKPISDIRASADYRKEMLYQIVLKELEKMIILK